VGSAQTPPPTPEQVRARRIEELTQEFLSDHPGVTFKTAYLAVQHEHPDLFPEMAVQDTVIENAGREAKLKDESTKLRQAQGHPSFAQAWALLQRTRPELFDWSESEAK
jgi:ATPase subunit of ABC transporter with duplicated ATPase domains